MIDNFISIKNLCFAFTEENMIINNVSFDIKRGTYNSLIGPNGSGKSTLFSLIGGFYNPMKGEVIIDNNPIKYIPIPQRAFKIAIIDQKKNLDFPYTCLEFVLMAFHPRLGRFEKITNKDLEEAKEIMVETKTWKFAEKKITELSGGEFQRLVLARALLQDTELLLLDEAMSELDVRNKFEMGKIIKKRIAEKNLTVLAIHHDLNLAYRFSDRVLVLENGKLIANDVVDRVFTPEFFSKVFGVDALVVPKEGFILREQQDNNKHFYHRRLE